MYTNLQRNIKLSVFDLKGAVSESMTINHCNFTDSYQTLKNTLKYSFHLGHLIKCMLLCTVCKALLSFCVVFSRTESGCEVRL